MTKENESKGGSVEMANELKLSNLDTTRKKSLR